MPAYMCVNPCIYAGVEMNVGEMIDVQELPEEIIDDFVLVTSRDHADQLRKQLEKQHGELPNN